MTAYVFLSAFPIVMRPIINTLFKKQLNSSPDTKKWFLFICGAVIFLSLALRGNMVGSEDSLGYYNTWRQLEPMSLGGVESYIEDSKMEGGFIYTVWAWAKIFKEPQIIFVITGAIYTIAVCRFIYLNSEDVLMSVVMFITLGLYEFMFQGMRQAIAMSICLFAFEFCKKRKLLPFILLIVLAMCYHRTAGIFVVVYFLFGIPMNGLSILISGIAGAVMIGASSFIAQIANDILDRDYAGAVEEGGFIALIIYALIIVVALLLKEQIKPDKKFSFFFFVLLLGAVIYTTRYTDVRIAERISFYFMFAHMVVLPNSIQKLEKNTRQILKIVILMLCLLLYYSRLGDSVMVPYEFYWQ